MRTIECSNGNKYTNYSDYLRSSHWRNKKKEYFDINKKECEHCNSLDKLHLHHKSYINIGNEKLTDLMCLCESCHSKEHKRLNVIKENRKNGRKKAKITKAKNKAKRKNKNKGTKGGKITTYILSPEELAKYK